MWWMMWPGSGLWWLMMLGMLLFWGFVLVVAWKVGSALLHDVARRPDEPLATLKRRYASGEITTEQFEEMRKRLQ